MIFSVVIFLGEKRKGIVVFGGKKKHPGIFFG
jgi:hypothetical protein